MLLRRAGRYGLKVDDLLPEAARLSDQYLAPPYPNFREEIGLRIEDYTEGLAKDFLKVAEKVWGGFSKI